MRLKVFLASLLAISAAALHATPSDYEIVPVNRSQVALTVSIAGTVTAYKTVQLAAQIPGRVVAISGREGDAFTAGGVLIQLDDAALLARREAAYAAREAAIAAIRNAQAQMRREYYSPRSDSTGNAPGGMGMPAMMDELFSTPMQGFMGMRDDEAQRYSDMVGVQTGVAQAQTNLRQAEANIMELEAALRDTRSIAPFSGVIENLYVEVGDTVQPGQPLVDFSESSNYKVEADLPVHLMRGLTPGQQVPVFLDNNGNALAASVYRIHPTADVRRHTVHVEFTLPPGTDATTGQYAELQVPDPSTGVQSQLTIPGSAVINKGGMNLVFAVDDQGIARLRVVRLGDVIGGDRVSVLAGITDSDQVVNNPPPGMRAGTHVRNEAPAAGQEQAATAETAEAGPQAADQQ
jgi:RND family efflux transporter MFP subunit